MAVNHGAIAAGFMHALRDPAVYAAWEKIDKSDAAAVGAFVQQTLGLAQTPSASDLSTMATYADQHLAAEHEHVKGLQKGSPHNCGQYFSSQQQ
jgi:hypothetical protein